MKYAAMITLLLTLACGEMWGTSYTWSFTNSSEDIADKTKTFTSTSGSKSLTYVGGSGDVFAGTDGSKYLKMNGKSGVSSSVYNKRYFSFKAPSSAGTVTILYGTTAANAEVLTGSTGKSTILSTISGTASTSCTSGTITNLTSGTTDVYIAFPDAAAYITSITWTDAADPTDNLLYGSLIKTTMETGATLSSNNAGQQTGSGVYGDYANYYRITSSGGSVTATFSPALTLNSNGSNRGRIRLYYSEKSFALSVNGSATGNTYASATTKKIYIAEYTIPLGTSSLSSVTMTDASSTSGGQLYMIEVYTYAAPSGYTVTYDANGGTGTMTDSDSPYEAGATVTVLENEFTKPGYPFTGWSAVDAEDHEVTITDGTFTMPSSNVTITAQWGDALVDTFKDLEHGSEEGHGGSSGLTRSGANKTTPNFTDFTPVNEYCNDLHYHFIGWVLSTSVNDNGKLKNDAVIVLGGQSGWNCTGATYYAVWAAENE